MWVFKLLKDRLIRHKLTVQDLRLNKAEGRIHLVIYFIDAHRQALAANDGTLLGVVLYTGY